VGVQLEVSCDQLSYALFECQLTLTLILLII
jgi:hypothetical protein